MKAYHLILSLIAVLSCKSDLIDIENEFTINSEDNSFSIIIIPDTQNYFNTLESKETFVNLLNWVNENANRLNVELILQTGDITNTNLDEEWQYYSSSFSLVDSNIPIIYCIGNHDYEGSGNPINRNSLFNKYINYNTLNDGISLKTIPFFHGQNENTSFLSLSNKLLIMSIEWFPRNQVIKWADSIVSNYKDYKTIILTHAFMDIDSSFYDFKLGPSNNLYGPLHDDKMNGQQLWTNFISQHKNIFLTINGHVFGSSISQNIGINNNTIHHIVYNTQHFKNGGDGWIKMLEFRQDSSIKIITFSPILKQISSLKSDLFEFTLD